VLSRRAVAAVAAGLLLLGGVGYAGADAADLVPGVLTTRPRPVPPPPFPVAPGATYTRAAGDVLPPVGVDAPVPDPARLAERLGPLLAAPGLGRSVSAVVLDGLTGTRLLDDAGEVPREPASVAKLLTGAAALGRLGPEATVPTRVVSGLSPDEVVLVGGGDVLLAAERGNPLSANGRAGLGDLAEQTATALREQGRATVAVRVDDSLFAGPRMGPGWTQADITAGFVAPVSAIAVNAGRTTAARYAPRVEDTAIAAAEAFSAQLRARGIHTVGEPARALAPAHTEQLGEVASAPVADVVGYMLAASDNNGAEALARLVARDMGRGTTFADAARAVLDEVGMLGVPTSGATLADGSGLSDGSRLPATLLADVLALAASDKHPELRPLLTGLPVAGLTGTLGQRFAGQDAGHGLGVVRAKTGSLNGVTSLAGAVRDADGRLLVFAVLADAVPGTEPARAAIDHVAAALASCGCR
jgi:D-alanyl-D-alanine carboxypeptidase/D-alanyl-D-alanine-endopeptidase (penicillin-binding protein 4)